MQLARPADVHAYYGTDAPRRGELMLLTAVRCMLCGISGKLGEDMDDDRAHVNVGKALEQLVRPRVRDLILPEATVQPSFAGRRVGVVGGQ